MKGTKQKLCFKLNDETKFFYKLDIFQKLYLNLQPNLIFNILIMEIHIENWSNAFWLFYTIQHNFETKKWIKLINEWNTCQNYRRNWNNFLN
jgi:hypothetical protein